MKISRKFPDNHKAVIYTSSKEWVKVDASKLNPLHHEQGSGFEVSSSLPPQVVPKAFKIDSDSNNIVIRFAYDLASLDEDEMVVETKRINSDSGHFSFFVGESSGRLHMVQISKEFLESSRLHNFLEVRNSLDQVKEQNPRWGSFSAVSNLLYRYAKKIADYTAEMPLAAH